MSNVAKTTQGINELAYLASFSDMDFEDAQGRVVSTAVNSISIKSNRFWLKSSEGTQEAPNQLKLHFVYLGGKKPLGRMYYAGTFDPEAPGIAPTCSSRDGVTPEIGSTIPIIEASGQPARWCRECPMSKWGSAFSKMTGKPIPACRTHKEIVVKVMGTPGAWLFRLPPVSVPQWDKATAKLRAAIDNQKGTDKAQLSLGNCVFEATFDAKATGILMFEPRGYVQGDELMEVVSLRKEPMVVETMLWGDNAKERKAQYMGSLTADTKQAVETPTKVTVEIAPVTTKNNTQQSPVDNTSNNVDDILASMGIA